MANVRSDIKDLQKMPHPSYQYPWTLWFDGQVWELTMGEDFFCTFESFRNQVHARAREKNMWATTRTSGTGTLLIQVTNT